MNFINPKLVYHVLFSASLDSFFFLIFWFPLFMFAYPASVLVRWVTCASLLILESKKKKKRNFGFCMEKGILKFDSFCLG